MDNHEVVKVKRVSGFTLLNLSEDVQIVALGRDINQIYIYELLKNFAFSLIGVFIPVYIVSQGFSLYHAALFIVISGFTGVILSYPVARIVSRIGFKHGLAASYLFVVPGLVMIQKLELSLILIVFASIFYNTGRVLHNICLNSEFAEDSDKEQRGKDSGRMLSLPSISRILGPAVGGVIYSVYSFQAALTVSIAALLLSIIPLLASRDHRDPMKYRFEDILKEEHLKTIPLFVIRGIQAVTAVAVFGLFVYYFVGGAMDVGWARAMDSLGFVLTGLVTGRLVQRLGKGKIIALGSTGAAAVHLARGFAVTPFTAFTISFVGGIFFQIYHVPVYSKFADEAEKQDILEFYTLRKIFVSLGNILTVATLAFFFYFYSMKTAFIATFVLAALSTLTMGFIGRNFS
jgi:MFS family permease